MIMFDTFAPRGHDMLVKAAAIYFKALSNRLNITVALKINSDSFSCIQIISTQRWGASHG